MENNTTNINKDQKYLDYVGLSHFFSSLDGLWWNRKFDLVKGQITTDINNLNTSISNKISSELEKYLPLSAGSSKPITGPLYVGKSDNEPSNIFIYGDILPGTTGKYNLGKPESGQGTGDGKLWANIYSDNIVTGNLTVSGQLSGQLSGNSSSANKTNGAISWGNMGEEGITELFKFDGSVNTFITAIDGLVLSQTIEEGATKSNYYQIGHSNNINAGTTHNSTGQLDFGSQIHIPKLSYDNQGHITESTWSVVTLPSDSSLRQDISDLQDQIDKIDNEIGFGNVVVGDVTIAADSHQGTLKFEAEGNITITADNVNDKIIISTTATTDAAITPENVNMYINNLLLNK